MKIRLLAAALLAAIVVMSGISCRGNSEKPGDGSGVFPREASIEEAGEVLGIDIPRPQYLPEGYEIQKVVLTNRTNVSLTISGAEDSEIQLNVHWKPEGGIPFKPVPPTVDINGPNSGSLSEGEDKNEITWNWATERHRPGLGILTLSASKDIPVAELILVARSVDSE